jgi:hypothetical protein
LTCRPVFYDRAHHTRNASDEDFGEMWVEGLNCYITMLGYSSMKVYGVAKETE